MIVRIPDVPCKRELLLLQYVIYVCSIPMLPAKVSKILQYIVFTIA